MKDLTLVVMAAGMGSRFGGPKQTQAIDDQGNFIIDYSVYDAIKAGFNHVVFVIKEESKDVFENTIGSRIKGKISYDYAYQKLEDIPSNMDISERVKPWGTVQAVLCSKPYVNGDFIVINADDFYGYDSFKKAYDFLISDDKADGATLAYPVKSTVWDSETVKRGILKIDGDKVTDIIESSIEFKADGCLCRPLNGSGEFKADFSTPVSVNMFAFRHHVYDLLDQFFTDFFKQSEDAILGGEALLPECLKAGIDDNKVSIKNIASNAFWMGMTYKEDLIKVMDNLSKLKARGEYPKNLWD